ncbi:MAG TPA: hypothetical protein VF920_16430, partial [Dongiaceae bacterium]
MRNQRAYVPNAGQVTCGIVIEQRSGSVHLTRNRNGTGRKTGAAAYGLADARSGAELGRDLGDMFALEAGDCQLVL